MFEQLYDQRVALEGMVLKPNMVVPGKKSAQARVREEVAEKTVQLLKACVPAAVPGDRLPVGRPVGRGGDRASRRHEHASARCPGALTFSYGRALQAAPQKAWAARARTWPLPSAPSRHRARMNGLAALGQWKADLERKAA